MNSRYLAFTVYFLLCLSESILSPSDFDQIFQSINPPLYAAISRMGSTINNNPLIVYSVSSTNTENREKAYQYSLT